MPSQSVSGDEHDDTSPDHTSPDHTSADRTPPEDSGPDHSGPDGGMPGGDSVGGDSAGDNGADDNRPGADLPDRIAPPVPRAAIAVAAAVPLVVLVAVLVMARGIGADDGTDDPDAPVAVVSVQAPDAESAECGRLTDELPDTLGQARSVEMVEPAPAGARAYRMPDGEPVVVRCGLPAPPGFRVGAPLQQVDEVQWFAETDPDPSITATTWVTVDRARYVAVTLPEGSGSGPIQQLSEAVAAAMDPVEPRPAAIR